MPWSDWDYLFDGIDKTRNALRQVVVRLEEGIADDSAIPAEVGVFFDLADRTYTDFHDSIGRDELIRRAEALIAAIQAQPDSILSWSERIVIGGELQQAVANERRNNDPSEPFKEVLSHRP